MMDWKKVLKILQKIKIDDPSKDQTNSGSAISAEGRDSGDEAVRVSRGLCLRRVCPHRCVHPGDQLAAACPQCLGKRHSRGNWVLNNFPLCHHLSSLSIKLTTDPAVKLVGSWAVCCHHRHLLFPFVESTTLF